MPAIETPETKGTNMLRALVTTLALAMAMAMAAAHAQTDKPKEGAAEKKAHGKEHTKSGAAKKDKSKEGHGGDHGKSGHKEKH
jgi:hypothetical protein